jgi:hypothetical protein
MDWPQRDAKIEKKAGGGGDLAEWMAYGIHGMHGMSGRVSGVCWMAERGERRGKI